MYPRPTQRDLFRGALLRALGYGSRAEEQMLASLAVKEVMTEDPVTTTPDASLADAGRLMLERQIGCLPVTDDDKRFIGLVTETDLLRYFAGLPPAS